MAYTQYEFTKAMNDMWELLKKIAHEDRLERLKRKHPVIEELDEYGPHGPACLGLGKMGGHAV